jgi:glycosyltransferase involved in cell wall biosynthesis
VSERHRQNLERRYPWLAAKFHVIPNGYDPEDFEEVPPRRPPQAGETIRFLYAGSLRGNQEVGRFFEVFGRMASDGHPISLELLGAFDPHFRQAAVADIDRAHLRINDSVPHADAIRAMAEAHVLVLFTGPARSGTDTTTGKLFEYMALRRPILLVGPRGPAAELVAGSGAGVVAEPADRPRLEEAILVAAEMAMQPRFAGAADDVVARFDRRALAARWTSLLRGISAGAGRP